MLGISVTRISVTGNLILDSGNTFVLRQEYQESKIKLPVTEIPNPMEEPTRESESSSERRESITNLSPIVGGKECCPNCGRPLQPLRCKLLCECGYFMSCSDF